MYSHELVWYSWPYWPNLHIVSSPLPILGKKMSFPSQPRVHTATSAIAEGAVMEASMVVTLQILVRFYICLSMVFLSVSKLHRPCCLIHLYPSSVSPPSLSLTNLSVYMQHHLPVCLKAKVKWILMMLTMKSTQSPRSMNQPWVAHISSSLPVCPSQSVCQSSFLKIFFIQFLFAVWLLGMSYLLMSLMSVCGYLFILPVYQLSNKSVLLNCPSKHIYSKH